MATRTIQIIDDDLDPEVEATGTIKFGVDGVWYEIDLSDKHQADFHKAISKYVEAGRRVAGKATKTAAKAPAKKAAAAVSAPAGVGTNGSNNDTGHSNKEIRDWARSNDVEVPPRGRIPAEVIAQFAAAHPPEADVA